MNITIDAIYTNNRNKHKYVVTNIFKDFNNHAKKMIVVSPMQSFNDYCVTEEQFIKEFTK